MAQAKNKWGRERRGSDLKRKIIAIKLTLPEYAEVKKMAEQFGGNINKLFRVKILKEKIGE